MMIAVYRHFLLFLFIFLLAAIRLFSQSLPVSVRVYSDVREEYAFPWAGGMNSCQAGKIDLDLDGRKDLILFDRMGDRIMPFVTVQAGDGFDYRYAPEFSVNFPVLSHWAIFADYDGDGKEDIFTYSPGFAGLKVYRNTSVNELEFTLEVYPFLTSYQGGGYVNILVTYADYPAISDLDGDGDLDILTFWGLGSFVEKHRNMSMEKYGNADSLDFEKTDYCWGYFAESEESNHLTLDTCLRCSGLEAWRHGGMEAWRHGGMGAWRHEGMEERHTGSTFRVLDLDGDGLQDLLLGDVDYPNLVALYNGGSADTARMAAYEWNFPADGQAVSLFSMPACFYDDFDFDGARDLLVSPFDPNPFLSENFESEWFYHNDGDNENPKFSLRTKAFLQDRMLDFGAGAYPVFYDVNGDGLTDLLIGNFGYYDSSYYDQYMILHTLQIAKIACLLNSGTAGNPAFTLADRDFAGASSLGLKGLVPALGDLDGDGDTDMLLGCETGKVILYLNTAGPGEPMKLELNDLNYQGIDVGEYSAPRLFDLDKDQLADLVVGEKGGNLNYYRNSGSAEKPAFNLTTDSLGKVNVTDPSVSLDGFSVPYLFRDMRDVTHLLIGSEQGEIVYFTDVDNNLGGKFERSDTLAGLIGVPAFKTDRGYRSAPSLADLDQDGFPELITGNFSGGLEYFGKNDGTPVNGLTDHSSSFQNRLKVYPSPARDHITVECPGCSGLQSAEICLYDFKGSLQWHYSGYFQTIQVLNTGSLPSGLYFLKITLNSKELNDSLLFTSRIIFY